jgi:hypothetical protein
MTLREEFTNEVKKENISDLDLLFRLNNKNYIQWLENKIISKENILNINEKVNLPQIHLSSTDGETKEEATEIVIHKMTDGSMFIEWYLRADLQKLLNCNQLQANFDSISKNKLVEFITSDVTYAS